MALCGHVTRNGSCRLDKDHKGQHRVTGVWTCDGCGRQRHGTPAGTARDGEYPAGLRFCIVCVRRVGIMAWINW